VAQHQAYHDACNAFVSWLRTEREQLATCADTFGEKTSIVGKIDRAKVSLKVMGKRTPKMANNVF
jgi:hypothetical protein